MWAGVTAKSLVCYKPIGPAALTLMDRQTCVYLHMDRPTVSAYDSGSRNRLNSVFETEFSLPFLPIFRNDAMALVGSQGTILSTMASISSENVAA